MSGCGGMQFPQSQVFWVRTSVFPSFYVFRVCMATGPTFMNNLFRGERSTVIAPKSDWQLWDGFVLVEKRERGRKERREWERHKRWRDKERIWIKKKKEGGKRKCGWKKEMVSPFRYGLPSPSLSPLPSPPAPSGCKETKGSMGLWHFPASWVASFSAYVHLCPTHSRCSVNVCWVERSTDRSPEGENDLSGETLSM